MTRQQRRNAERRIWRKAFLKARRLWDGRPWRKLHQVQKMQVAARFIREGRIEREILQES